MQVPAIAEKDPIRWCAAIALAFLALALIRLGIPSDTHFDEIHYVPAARSLLELMPANREHPPLGKELVAAAIALLGDKPGAWRLPSALFGAFGLFACGRAMWWLTRRRFATIAAMVLVATGFAWFIQSRIAMLDIFAASLAIAGLWHFLAAAYGRVRLRFALSGVLLGLALSAKWSVAPLVILPGLAVLIATLRRSPAYKPVSLGEAALWLGLLPLATYWATYAPLFFLKVDPVGPLDFIGHHLHMIDLQDSVVRAHPYQSQWYQWAVNWRPIWYLYEMTDGAQRGILMLGNPLTMLLGLPALAWCAFTAWRKARLDAAVLVIAYVLTLAFWIVSTKPVLFYYHYLLPGTALLCALALALDAIWHRRSRWRWLAPATVLASVAMFAWFYPIISAAPLSAGRNAFLHWMWLDSWR
jgi:dolichyl-phosphate-mannose--protein O-mannosyl transferase